MATTTEPRRPLGRAALLVTSCVGLGIGVALLLDARLGADGYATFVNGLHRLTGVPFWILNIAVGVAFLALAWKRGVVPGIGTIVQPVVVGVTVSAVTPICPSPIGIAPRAVELAFAFVLVCVGVAGYLASRFGAGPTEAAALAWDPPVPFRWSYALVQIGGAGIGWLLGADVGVGTALVVLLIGPVVDVLSRLAFRAGPAAAL